MNPWKWFRYTVMIAFLAFISWVGYRHQVVGGGPAGVPTVDALCPLGGLESIYSFVASGTWLRRVAPSSLVLFAGVVAMTVLFGRVFCGWICPLGTVGELSAAASRRLGIRKVELPEPLGRILRFGKYIVLGLVLYFTWNLGTLAWREYDPWAAWMHLSAGWEEMASSPWGFAVLFGIVIGAGAFVERFWCRYLCPLGAALAIFQKISLTRVVRNGKTCISCGRCDRSCPMGLAPMGAQKVTDGDCISCGRCTESCPVDGTLSFSLAGKKVLSALAVGLLGVGLFLGIYAGARALGFWNTWAVSSLEAQKDPVDGVFGWMNIRQVAEQVKLPPAKVLEIGRLPADSPLDVAMKKMGGVNDEVLKEQLKEYFAAHPAVPSSAPQVPNNPDEIKGSLTLEEVASGYGLDSAVILKKAGWPEDTPRKIPLKDAGKAIGRETSDIRAAVRELLKK